MIICKGSREKKTISSELEKNGYDVELIGLEELYFNSLDLSGFNLAIISLHPDISATWNAYLDFRHQFPGFPVLVCMGHHGVDRLKSAIKNVLIKNNPPTDRLLGIQ
ncbi:MAG: hypothetical protein R6U40_07025 [Desulfobacterales bacterium]